VINMPAQHDLSGSFAVFFSQGRDHLVLQWVPWLLAFLRRIAIHTADGRPRLGDDTMLAISIRHGLLHEKRMQFDLVQCGDHLGFGDQAVQMRRAEVAHTNRAGSPFCQKTLCGLPCAKCPCELGRHRPVQQIEIKLIQPELAHRAVKGVQCLIITIIADPQFCDHEKVTSVNIALRDPLTYLSLVAVCCGGVDQTISTGNGAFDRAHRFLGAALIDTKSQGRHFDAIVELQDGAMVHVIFLSV